MEETVQIGYDGRKNSHDSQVPRFLFLSSSCESLADPWHDPYNASCLGYRGGGIPRDLVPGILALPLGETVDEDPPPTDSPHGAVEAKYTSYPLEPITSSRYVDSRVMLVIVDGDFGVLSLETKSLRSALRGLRIQRLRDIGHPGWMQIKGANTNWPLRTYLGSEPPASAGSKEHVPDLSRYTNNFHFTSEKTIFPTGARTFSLFPASSRDPRSGI